MKARAITGILLGALNLRIFLSRLRIFSDFEAQFLRYLVWTYAGFQVWTAKFLATYIFDLGQDVHLGGGRRICTGDPDFSLAAPRDTMATGPPFRDIAPDHRLPCVRTVLVALHRHQHRSKWGLLRVPPSHSVRYSDRIAGDLSISPRASLPGSRAIALTILVFVLTVNLCALWGGHFHQQARWLRQDALRRGLQRAYQEPPAAVFSLTDHFPEHSIHAALGASEVTGLLHVAWDDRPTPGVPPPRAGTGASRCGSDEEASGKRLAEHRPLGPKGNNRVDFDTTGIDQLWVVHEILSLPRRHGRHGQADRLASRNEDQSRPYSPHPWARTGPGPAVTSRA